MEETASDTWNLEDLYKTPADWDKDYEKAGKLAEEIAAFQGHIGESADSLVAWFKKADEAELLLSSIYSYASLAADQDLGNNENQAPPCIRGSVRRTLCLCLCFQPSSIMVPPFFSSPFFSASFIMYVAVLSFTLPAGLYSSSLAKRFTPVFTPR